MLKLLKEFSHQRTESWHPRKNNEYFPRCTKIHATEVLVEPFQSSMEEI
jgi:hypothetical protein